MASLLDLQTNSIIALLRIWPQAPERVIKEYLYDVLDTTLTRACLQSAKKKIGLTNPRHRKLTLMKEAAAKLSMCTMLDEDPGCDDHQLRVAIRAGLREFWPGQATNTQLLTSWVVEMRSRIEEVSVGIHAPEVLLRRLSEVTAQVRVEASRVEEALEDARQGELPL